MKNKILKADCCGKVLVGSFKEHIMKPKERKEKKNSANNSKAC